MGRHAAVGDPDDEPEPAMFHQIPPVPHQFLRLTRDPGPCNSLARMPKQDVSILSALEARTRGVCLDIIRENPTLTVSDLQTLCHGEFGTFISAITLGELFPGAAEAATKASRKPQAAKPPRKASTQKPSKTKAPRTTTPKAPREKPAKAAPDDEESTGIPKPAVRTEVDTRTSAGRQAFDEAIFRAVQSIGSPASAGDIQQFTGGTNMQVRAACNRLIEAGRLSWSGKARGTRYFPA